MGIIRKGSTTEKKIIRWGPHYQLVGTLKINKINKNNGEPTQFAVGHPRIRLGSHRQSMSTHKIKNKEHNGELAQFAIGHPKHTLGSTFSNSEDP